MNKEDVYKAITEIDSAFIDEAEGYERPKPAPLYVRFIYAAAALLLIAVCLFAVVKAVSKPSRHEAALPGDKTTVEPTDAPQTGNAPEKIPNSVPRPDPIVPDTNAHNLAMVVKEWYKSTGSVEVRVFEYGMEKHSVSLTQAEELIPITHALADCFEAFENYTNGDDFTDLTAQSDGRIDVCGDGASISVWEGLNYVRYTEDGFTRWFLLEGYCGSDHGREYLFDELFIGLFPQETDAGRRTEPKNEASIGSDPCDDTIFVDGVLMMESPDEPGVYVPVVDRSEELMRIFNDAGKSEDLLEFERRFIEARNEMREGINSRASSGKVGYGMYYEEDFHFDFVNGTSIRYDIICPILLKNNGTRSRVP